MQPRENQSKKQIFFINDPHEMKKIAGKLSLLLDKNTSLLVIGDLGVGKTTFVQFLCAELGIEEKITSPTFSLLKRYWSKEKSCFVNHFDFFRINSSEDAEVFCEVKEDNINIIEWPEKAPFFFAYDSTIEIRIFYHGDGRRIETSQK